MEVIKIRFLAKENGLSICSNFLPFCYFFKDLNNRSFVEKFFEDSFFDDNKNDFFYIKNFRRLGFNFIELEVVFFEDKKSFLKKIFENEIKKEVEKYVNKFFKTKLTKTEKILKVGFLKQKVNVWFVVHSGFNNVKYNIFNQFNNFLDEEEIEKLIDLARKIANKKFKKAKKMKTSKHVKENGIEYKKAIEKMKFEAKKIFSKKPA